MTASYVFLKSNLLRRNNNAYSFLPCFLPWAKKTVWATIRIPAWWVSSREADFTAK